MVKKISILGILVAALTTASAFAARDNGPSREATLATVQQEMAASGIRVEGTVNCRMPETNTGEACIMKITDTETGEVYTLRDANALMELYNTGKREFRIDGSLTDAATIAVKNASAL